MICGTSAGAIDAAALAGIADRFEASVEVLAKVWQNFSAAQVSRADSPGVIRSGAQWLTRGPTPRQERTVHRDCLCPDSALANERVQCNAAGQVCSS